MAEIINKTWKFFARLDLTVWTFCAIVVNLIIGLIYYKINPDIFISLDRLMIVDWIATYGISSLKINWWFFLFMFLLLVLGINTFVCTTDRAYRIIKNYKRYSSTFNFILKLSPHIIHYAYLLIILGYLVFYVFGEIHYHNILKKDIPLKIPGSNITVHLEEMVVDFYEDGHFKAFEGRAIDARATLKFIDDEKGEIFKKISMNNPVYYMGYHINLKDFRPLSKTSSRARSFLNVTIRKSPGLFIFLGGILVFTIGIILYIIQILKKQFKMELNT